MYLPPHIVVLVHGSNGSPSDFDSVEQTIMGKYDGNEILVIKSNANHTKTALGVDIGGAKLAVEIVHVILDYELNPRVSCYKISFIAHSLGGLYARYAIVQLQQELSMLNMEYVSFITLCTPHLGSRRPRADSAFKNALRLGVHRVLSSKQLYGQTGVDLLVVTEPTDEVENDGSSKQPVLEAMSEPDSPFILALQRFQFCTLIAMADGDVVVPYASASIRNYNPYPSLLLSNYFTEWRWHIRHYGFEAVPLALQTRLQENVNDTFRLENPFAGLEEPMERFMSTESFDCDNKHEVEFPFTMLYHLQHAIKWRRLDIVVEPCGVVGKLRLHDWPINKQQQSDCRATEFIELLVDMICSDHGLSHRQSQTDPPPRVEAKATRWSIDEGGRLAKWKNENLLIPDSVWSLFPSIKRDMSSVATEAPSEVRPSSSVSNDEKNISDSPHSTFASTTKHSQT